MLGPTTIMRLSPEELQRELERARAWRAQQKPAPVDIREIPEPRQNASEVPRRVFMGGGFSLVVWFYPPPAPADPLGFQLSYVAGTIKQSVEWRNDSGYCNYTVDTGSDEALGIKASDVLLSSRIPFPADLLDWFARSANQIPSDLVLWLLETLAKNPIRDMN